MTKIVSLHICSKCAYESSKWLGKCPQCEAWNSFEESEKKIGVKSPASKIKAHARTPQAFEFASRNALGNRRQPIGILEIDRVIGGGIVPGSILLLTGEPGIGKSTITLQIAEKLSNQGQTVLYCTGEESEEQVAMRGKRLGLPLKNLKLLNETNLETIIATAEAVKADFLIVDSVQVISSAGIPGGAGSVSQVRLCTEAIMEFAKPKRLSVLLIGHVTKDGTLAGPRVLEHLVDAVFMIEGDRYQEFRLLRGLKNRYGGTNEVGVFEMTENGLREVQNPSEKFLSQHTKATPGVSFACIMEGTRPFIVEVQALTSKTNFGYPKRTASGFDVNRLNLLAAVIERHLRLPVNEHDIYLNVVSGMKLTEPAADLAVIMAIISSLKNSALPEKTAYSGEVGLAGEIRKPLQLERREQECKKMGLNLEGNKNGHVELRIFTNHSRSLRE